MKYFLFGYISVGIFVREIHYYTYIGAQIIKKILYEMDFRNILKAHLQYNKNTFNFFYITKIAIDFLKQTQPQNLIKKPKTLNRVSK